MANVEKQRNRLIKLLKELFQLDQPDLDFGFYKIMHAKADTVSNFLEKDLLGIIQGAFGEADEAKVEETRITYEAAIKQAEEFGAPDPEKTPAVKKAKAAYDDAKDSGSNEGDVYEHLYRFFERYYDNGDFMSRRYFMRETDGKAAPYSVPYDGREVYLHWANRDQYYIKTSEYLTNFTFDIARHFKAHERATYKMPERLKMHCRIIEASEGDHNNVKASENSERFFIIHEDTPIIMEDGELVIQFEYRPDPSKTGQKKLIDAAEEKILHALTGLSAASIYNEALRTQIGEDKNKRLLLRKYINQYSARNTMDYFIHKDLGGFMRRELDFYIKNEIMRLDDIESADVPRVESYLAKIKVLRKIAGELVTFLTQLEEFQKKIWLKKKFVTETNYCITLDRIPESFYDEITTNDAQREEWVKLFAIDEIQADLVELGYSAPLTTDFLKANPFLVLDTAFFTEEFKNNLLSEIQHIDENMDGLLIHSENFQALEFISKNYSKKISNVYIDPPYNTGDDGFSYKDAYQSSSWLTMVDNRLDKSNELLRDDGVTFISIGDEEQEHLATLVRSKFGKKDFFSTLVWEKKKKGSFLSGNISKMKDYILCIAKNEEKFQGLIGEIKVDEETYPCVNASNPRETRYIRKGIISKFKEKNYTLEKGSIISAGNMNLILNSDLIIKDGILKEDFSIEGNWRYSQEKMTNYCDSGDLYITQDLYLRRIVKEPRYKRMKDILLRKGSDGEGCFRDYDINNLGKHGWSSNEDANDELHQLLGKQYAASYPKPSKLLTLLLAASRHKNGWYLDYFAGSGTTGHAVINLNREDSGSRKYILVEMGNCFDTVTKPRIQKVVYSKDWKDGKPISRAGISHCFKYIRLESYEDALNNLAFQGNEKREQALAGNDDFRRDYMLKYWIDFETKDSPSLLNIDRFSDPSRYVLKANNSHYKWEFVTLRYEPLEAVYVTVYLLNRSSIRLSSFS